MEDCECAPIVPAKHVPHIRPGGSGALIDGHRHAGLALVAVTAKGHQPMSLGTKGTAGLQVQSSPVLSSIFKIHDITGAACHICAILGDIFAASDKPVGGCICTFGIAGYRIPYKGQPYPECQ